MISTSLPVFFVSFVSLWLILSSPHQLPNGRGVADKVCRAAVRRVEDLARVDAEFRVDRRDEVLRREHPLDRGEALHVRGPDDLTAGHAAAREQYAHRVRPVVADRVLVDLWGAAELTQRDHQCGI